MSTEQNTTTSPVAEQKPNNKRVFIGNLTVATKEENLIQLFEAFGKVENAKIVNNKAGSTFGFVEMENEESAQKAITGLNKSTVEGQVVDVEIAKERVKTRRAPQPRRPKTTAPTTTQTNGTTSPVTNGQKPKRRNPRKQGTEKANTTSTATTSTTTTPVVNNAGDANTTAGTNTTGNKRQGRLVRARNNNNNTTTTTTTTNTTTSPTTPRAQSTTTLFITNLPFSCDDAQLLDIFKDYKPKSAHVITNKYNKKSKGFGFVEFDDAAEQQKALVLNKSSVKSNDKDREIYVKVAYVADIKTATADDTTTTPVQTTSA